MKQPTFFRKAITTCCLLAITVVFMRCASDSDGLTLNQLRRVPAVEATQQDSALTSQVSWKPTETAIVICDMWDKHWCKGATERVVEMAPAIDDFITAARNKGVLIVHAPSGCMKYYEGHPARANATKYNAQDKNFDKWRYKTEAEAFLQWPIDSVTQGCNDTPYCEPADVWTKGNDLIQITDNDVISDSGSELAAVYKDKGIKNVLMVGVHTNMCVIGRSFAIRSLKEQGLNVALVRDLTDAMYDHRQWPYVSHFAGLGLMIDYIEKHLCPTIESTDLTNKTAFRFKDDDRTK